MADHDTEEESGQDEIKNSTRRLQQQAVSDEAEVKEFAVLHVERKLQRETENFLFDTV